MWASSSHEHTFIWLRSMKQAKKNPPHHTRTSGCSAQLPMLITLEFTTQLARGSLHCCPRGIFQRNFFVVFFQLVPFWLGEGWHLYVLAASQNFSFINTMMWIIFIPFTSVWINNRSLRPNSKRKSLNQQTQTHTLSTARCIKTYHRWPLQSVGRTVFAREHN